jgi:hypothetical protein
MALPLPHVRWRPLPSAALQLTSIDLGMHVEERAHAYQINKTALASTPVNL